METGDQVLRDMFYDGRAAFEPGAVLTRYARSFIRFGHFDLLASEGNLPMLEKLLSYVLELEGFASCELSQANLRLFFTKLCCKTAELIGQWFRVGFVHGVLNTDNMSIHGLTIDFGPYGWLDIYDPKWTPNTSDPYGRYGFEQQANIAYWNLLKLSQSLQILCRDDFTGEGLEAYKRVFKENYFATQASKIGLTTSDEVTIPELLEKLKAALLEQEFDYLIFFRSLAELVRANPNNLTQQNKAIDQLIADCSYQSPKENTPKKIRKWLEEYMSLIIKDKTKTPEHRAADMDRVNPYVVPRNFQVQKVIESLYEGDPTLLHCLQKAIETPFEKKSSNDFIS